MVGLRSWMLVLLVGGAVSALGLDDRFRSTSLLLAGAVFVGALTHAIRRSRRRNALTWWFVLSGGLASLAQTLVRVHGGSEVTAVPVPTDLAGFASFALIAAGLVHISGRRSHQRRREDVTDAMISAAVAGMALGAVVFARYFLDPIVPGQERLLTGARVVCVVVLVGVIARVALGPGARNPAYYLLAAGTTALVAAEVFWAVATARLGDTATASVVLVPFAHAVTASAVLHPDVDELTRRTRVDDQGVGRRRLVLLAAAMLAGPALLVSAELGFDRVYRVGTVSATAVVSLLVLLRMSDLVRDRELATVRERRLRKAATGLAVAADQHHILTTLVEVSEQMLRGRRRAVELHEVVDGRLVGSPRTTVGRSLEPVRALPLVSDAIVAAMASGAIGVVDDVGVEGKKVRANIGVVPLVTAAGRSFVVLVAQTPLITRDQVAGYTSIAAQVTLALDGVDLREESHQRRSNRRFRALVENSSDVVLVLDEAGRITFASPTVRRLLGREEDAVVGHEFAAYVYRPDQLHVRRLLATPGRHARSGLSSAEIRMIHGDGGLRWFEAEARDLTADEEVGGIVITASDINERKAAEDQLLRSEARFRLMVQNSSDVVAIVDETAVVTYVSPSIERMLGFPPAEVLGRDVFDLLSVTESERIRAMPRDRMDRTAVEVRVQGRTGIVHVLEVGVTDMRDEPAVGGIVLNVRDVTDRKSLEDDLRYQAMHDHLTGLGNRAMFAEGVAEALTASSTSDGLLAVLFVDLDDFKLINDSLGHVVGDQILVTVGHRVQQCLRYADLAARLGGDEFAVLLTSRVGENEVLELVEAIRESISRPIEIAGQQLTITASIGVAVDLDRSTSADDLLRSADLAMYQAKQDGKNRHELFAEAMQTSAVEELELKRALSRAVDNEEFVLFYQPIVDLVTGQMRGVEALIRWFDPDRGMVSPGAFIPLAEETGLIRPIGMWVVERAARDIAAWRADGHDLYVSVNVSVHQMAEDDFVQQITRRVLDAHVPPSSMVVELTESMLAGEHTSDVFRRLRRRGFRIALDDFGTGFSGLQYLQSFDIDLIKIDRSFVQSMGASGNTGVVKAILDIARNVDAHTVAEGIEEDHERAMLAELGVELAQGFHFARPMPFDDLSALLAHGNDLIPPTGHVRASH